MKDKGEKIININGKTINLEKLSDEELLALARVVRKRLKESSQKIKNAFEESSKERDL